MILGEGSVLVDRVGVVRVSEDGCQKISWKGLEISWKFLRHLPEISRNRGCVRGVQIDDIAQRQYKILILSLVHGLHQNDPTIMMSDSPVEYLRKCNLTLI